MTGQRTEDSMKSSILYVQTQLTQQKYFHLLDIVIIQITTYEDQFEIEVK